MAEIINSINACAVSDKESCDDIILNKENCGDVWPNRENFGTAISSKESCRVKFLENENCSYSLDERVAQALFTPSLVFF